MLQEQESGSNIKALVKRKRGHDAPAGWSIVGLVIYGTNLATGAPSKKKKRVVRESPVNDAQGSINNGVGLDDEQVIEEILERRKVKGGWEYLIRWQGFPEEHNEWLPGAAVEECEALDRFYHARGLDSGEEEPMDGEQQYREGGRGRGRGRGGRGRGKGKRKK